MAQEIINVGPAPNDGLGDPIRTAFIKTNNNFSELYARVQVNPPPTPYGSVGDEYGFYAMDSNYFYYCFQTYTDGSQEIWAQIAQSGGVNAAYISNGNTIIRIATANGNATINVHGTSNVVTFANTGVYVSGIVSSTGNITGGNLIANTTIIGPALNIGNSGILSAGTISAVGDSVANNVLVNSTVSASGNIITDGYFVGTFAGNITGNLVVPGANTDVLFNTNGNSDAVSGFTYDKASNTLTVLGIVSSAGNTVAGNLTTAGIVSAQGNVYGYNIFAENVFSNTFIGSNGDVAAGANVSAVGNVSGNYILGNGAFLTGVASSSYGNANVAAYLPTYTGNLAALTGNVTTTANISANYIIGNGSQLTGLPAGYANANVAAYLPTYTGNISAGNVAVTNIISSTGNIVTAGYFVGNFAGNVTGNIVVPGANTQVLFNTNGNVDAVAGLTYNKASNVLAVAGNVNAITVSASGNVTGNYFIGNGAALTGIASGTYIVNGSSNVSVTANSVVTVAVTGNTVATFVATGMSLAGNVTAGNVNSGILSATGVVATTGNVNTGNLSATGNISASGFVNATGNITGNYFIGNGSQLTGISTTTSQIINGATNVSIPASGGNVATVINGSGNIVVVAATGQLISGIMSASGNVTGGNLLSAGQISTTGNATHGNINTAGQISAGGNILGGNLSVSGNITGNFNLDNAISATGNITGGNINTGGNIIGNNSIGIGTVTPFGTVDIYGATTSITNGFTNANLTVGAYQGTTAITTIKSSGSTNFQLYNGFNFVQYMTLTTTGLSVTGGVSATANVTAGNVVTNGIVSANGIVNIGSESVTGNITASNLSVSTGTIIAGNIINGNGNGVGNIGNASNYFNTVFATSTSALYADLAENYLADDEYAPGTILSFGGDEELTLSTQDQDPFIAGIVSTAPAYNMNAGLKGDYVTKVALVGRVPCLVQGPIRRGQMLVSAGNGRARAETSPAIGTVIGKALENFDGEFGTIEIVVGRL